MNRGVTMIVLLGAVLCWSSTAWAVRDVYVMASIQIDPEEQDGQSWETAYKFLQDALESAQPGDVIHVALGTYHPDDRNAGSTGERDESFYLISAIEVFGGYPEGGGDEEERDPENNKTYLSGDLNDNDGFGWTYYGDNSFHVVRLPNVESPPTIDGFIIEGGYANQESGTHSMGAGILAEEDLTIRNCIVQGSWAHTTGGGLYLTNAYATIVDCQFVDNRSAEGAAAHIGPSGAASISGTMICGNMAHRGGGLHLAGSGVTTLFSSTFFYNRTTENYYSNTCGGAIYIASGGVEATNCVFNSNLAGIDGGAVYHVSAGGLQALNCTFYRNWAAYPGGSGNGGGIYQTEDSTVTNCIFWENHDMGPIDPSAQIYVYSGTATVTFSCINDLVEGPPYPFGGSANHNIDEDPHFVDAPDDLHLNRMYCYSPCINVGSNTAIAGVDTDRDGNPRVVHEIVDMGAYEVQEELVAFCCSEELENPPACMGDADGDKYVGPADVALVKFYYGSTDDEALCRCDIDCNGTIDPVDVGWVKLSYGVCVFPPDPNPSFRPCWEYY